MFLNLFISRNVPRDPGSQCGGVASLVGQCTLGQQTWESEENQNRIFSLLKMSPLVLKCRHRQEKFKYANQIL